MARTVRSARGVEVDFDLLRIKENLGQAPKASTVKAREDFIDQKLKRRVRRMTESASAAPAPSPSATVISEDVVADSEHQDVQLEVSESPVKKIIKQPSAE